jgi:hypothetical protein
MRRTSYISIFCFLTRVDSRDSLSLKHKGVLSCCKSVRSETRGKYGEKALSVMAFGGCSSIFREYGGFLRLRRRSTQRIGQGHSQDITHIFTTLARHSSRSEASRKIKKVVTPWVDSTIIQSDEQDINQVFIFARTSKREKRLNPLSTPAPQIDKRTPRL